MIKAGFPLLGVRDYIHIVDLAKGHIAALRKLKESCGCKVGRRQQEGLFPVAPIDVSAGRCFSADL